MKKVKSNKRFYLENQFDKIRMIFNLIVGIGIITVPILQNTYETGPFEKISFILIGLSLIIPVTINRRSVSFDKTKNCNFKMEDSDFTITRTDKKITFSKFGIKLLKKNDQVHYINDLALNRDEVSNIMKSINSGLDTKSLEFYWLSESKIEKITATNKELR